MLGGGSNFSEDSNRCVSVFGISNAQMDYASILLVLIWQFFYLCYFKYTLLVFQFFYNRFI